MIHINISEINEILDALKKTSSAESALGLYNDFIEAVSLCSYPQLLKILRDHAESFAVDNGLCPLCNNELHIESWSEPRGEYQGVPSYERTCQLVCDECGYIKD